MTLIRNLEITEHFNKLTHEILPKQANTKLFLCTGSGRKTWWFL